MMQDGEQIRLTTDIWGDGQDHHPPGYRLQGPFVIHRVARKGEILVVREVRKNGSLAVSHEHITDRSFIVYDGEHEPVTQ